MIDEYLTIQLICALFAGYLLGSIPFALLAARYRGMNIFATGSRTAGTANVFWNIGRGTGTAVFMGDVAKGSAAVLIAWLLDVPWSVALLAGGAAVLGHWKSVFTRFRGGDGMATLVGVTVTLVPVLATLGIIIGFATVLLLSRSPLRSAWGLSSSFIVMLGVSQYYQIDRELVMGLVALAMLVLFRSVISYRHRSSASDEEEPIDLDLAPDEESDLAPAAPENS